MGRARVSSPERRGPARPGIEIRKKTSKARRENKKGGLRDGKGARNNEGARMNMKKGESQQAGVIRKARGGVGHAPREGGKGWFLARVTMRKKKRPRGGENPNKQTKKNS